MKATIDLSEFDGYTPLGGGWYLLFTAGKCDTCGQRGQEPNAVKAQPEPGAAWLRANGLTKFLFAPPEIFNNDDGEIVCERCA